MDDNAKTRSSGIAAALKPFLDFMFAETPAYKHAAVRAPAKSFMENVNRSTLLLALGPSLVRGLQLDHEHQLQVIQEAWVSAPNLPQMTVEDAERMLSQQVTRTHQRLTDEFNKGYEQDPKGWLTSTLLTGADEFDKYLGTDVTGYFQHGVHSLLTSAIVGMWTAVETLASDLWVAAVNAHPKCLARLRGTWSRIERKAGASTKSDGGRQLAGQANATQDKVLSLETIGSITRDTYDASRRMGTLLSGRYRFQLLGGIREAYSEAFSVRHDRIDEALADDSLDALNAVRNVIVHRAGVADSRYERVCKFAKTAPRLKADEALKLDGEVVGSLVSPVIACCGSLLTAVDSWLDSSESPRADGGGDPSPP